MSLSGAKVIMTFVQHYPLDFCMTFCCLYTSDLSKLFLHSDQVSSYQKWTLIMVPVISIIRVYLVITYILLNIAWTIRLLFSAYQLLG